MRECNWERYGGELQATGLLLQVKMARRRQRNRAVHLSLQNMYFYWKNGRMKGDVPACVGNHLQQL
ncbi:hypothetical protein PHMEG_00021257 [Phytophthora megakarya]|uniref:Uncharacterized protein n=1 Tax=Phytophthora megakarya TaxID=4795 RepID=A0A225VN78_9STRA|nr:hypothetical protein PHMEG_00021257 [Phytophthora megakarya]